MFDLLGGLLVMLLVPKLGKFLLKCLFYACVIVPIQCAQLLIWLLKWIVYGISLLEWNAGEQQGERPQTPQLHLFLWNYWDE